MSTFLNLENPLIIGRKILSLANDIKRTPEALASDLDIDLEFLMSVIKGNASPLKMHEVIYKIVDKYPISIKEILSVSDDTNNGIKKMDSIESIKSTRIFKRPDANENLEPYYEYRDTVTSRIAPFKPEWISQKRFVNDDDPYNPDVIYNNGHLQHQVTFFVGPVNFYWESNGKKYCSKMNTGDSNYITPYVPHSFTCREKDTDCYIVAITFGGSVSDALDYFYMFGSEDIERISGDARSLDNLFKARLDRYLNAESLDYDWLKNELINMGLDTNGVEDLFSGKCKDLNKLEKLASKLNVDVKDLTFRNMEKEGEVILKYNKKEVFRIYPSTCKEGYKIRELARVTRLPYVKGFDIQVNNDKEIYMKHSLHEYIYNYGNHAVVLNWNDNEEILINPGDSVYIRPFISHGFKKINTDKIGNLILLRIPGVLTNEVIDEYSSFSISERYRACGEDKRWF